MIKVYHVVESLGGGVFTYFKNITRYFAADTLIETTIIYSDNRKEVRPEEIKAAFADNIRLIRLPMEQAIKPMKDLTAIRRLVKLLKTGKPDVLHLHSSKAGALGRVAVPFLPFKPKVFYTPHGYSFLRKDIGKIKRSVFWSIEKTISRFSKAITVACGDTEYQYAKQLGRAVLVRNGIDPSFVRQYKRENINDRLTIGILGRITYARNPSLFNALANAMPDIQFIWIGDGELRKELTAPNIEITGWFTNQVDGLKHLNKLDIYVQPSLWEGLPIALLEAMSLEIPVVATNIVGNKDVVIHEETGFLVENESDFISSLEKLQDAKLRASMGLKGYKRILSDFDVNSNLGILRSYYLSDRSDIDL